MESVSINKVELQGIVQEDARIIQTQNGNWAVRFILATSETVRTSSGCTHDKKVCHNIVAWSHEPQKSFKHIRKGCTAHVHGKIRYTTYMGAAGDYRTAAEILATEIIIR